MNLKIKKLSMELEEVCEWSKWRVQIPFIKWPSNWLVKAVPPSHGAIVRYLIIEDGYSDNSWVSVYLDCYDVLGYYGCPYWEIFPGHAHIEDTNRIPMEETDGLLSIIADGLCFLKRQMVEE